MKSFNDVMKSFDEYVRNGRIKFRQYITEARSRGINENIFAESLLTLIKGQSWDFLTRTEIDPIKGIVKEVIKKVYDNTGSSVYILDTYMGGGKTHTMAFLYFIFRNTNVALDVKEFKSLLNDLNILDVPPVRIIPVDGNSLNDKLALNEQEIFKDFLGKSGTREEVKEALSKEGKPVIFLIDEILDYFDKRGENYQKDLAYLKTLIEGISEMQKDIVVISFPNIMSDKYEKYRSSDIYDTLQRKGRSDVPIREQEDFTKVLKKQIFEYIDPALLSDIDKYIGKIFVKERLEKYKLDEYKEYFPFHPELVKVIYDRLSSFPGFQRTRGGLKLIAHISADLYSRIMSGEKMDSPFLTIGDIDLMNVNIKSLLARENVFNIRNLEVIINSDIKNSDSLNKKILTNVYMYSLFPDKEKRGVTPGEIYISLLEKNLSIDAIENILFNLQENKIYLSKDAPTKKFFFKPEPNIYALINSYNTSPEEKNNVIKNFLKKILDYKNPEVSIQMIDDLKELNVNDKKLVLGVITIDFLNKNEKLYKIKEMTDIFDDIFDEVKKYNPTSINNLIFLSTSYRNIHPLEDIARKYSAIEHYEKEYSKRKSTENKEVLEELKEEKEKTEQRITNDIMRCYNYLVYLKHDKVVMYNNIKHVEKTEDYRQQILDILEQNDKVFTSPSVQNFNISEFFRSLMGGREEYSIQDALKNIKKSTALPFLTENTFNAVLKKGIQEGVIGYKLGEIVRFKEDVLDFNINGTILSSEKAKRLKLQESGYTETNNKVQSNPEIKSASKTEFKGMQTIEKTLNKKNEVEKYFNILNNIAYVSGPYKLEINFNLGNYGQITLAVDSDKVSNVKRLFSDLYDLINNITVNFHVKLNEEQYKKFLEFEK